MFLLKYQDRDKCGAHIAFTFNSRQCVLFFKDLIFSCWSLGTWDTDRLKQVSVMIPELRDNVKVNLLHLSALQNKPTTLSRKVAD